MTVADVVDTDRYPLADPGGDAWRAVVARTRGELADVGCSVLSGFIRAESFDALRNEGERAAPDAYYQVEIVNVYNTDPDPSLPADHPGHVTMERGNAFVPRDRIEPSAVIHRLYTSPEFQRFVADCFELDRLYELADPLSGLVLNVIRPGYQHPWHFDTNEFTVSLLTQEAEDGGVFEYCPNIRSASDEHLDDVAAVLAGDANHMIHRLTLRPGDLQLFKGRFALHRVSEVRGGTDRHTAIFAFSERPGVIGSVARTKQLFGRVLPEHLDAEKRVRGDSLLD
jgi:hypothetical protein